jgi:hypothetical protein
MLLGRELLPGGNGSRLCAAGLFFIYQRLYRKNNDE